MKILTSAMLAPDTALLAGLLGFVLTALFFALIPSARRASRGDQGEKKRREDKAQKAGKKRRARRQHGAC